MNRRRRRLPFIVLIAIALVLGTTLGIVAARVGPRASLLALLPDSSSAPAPTASSTTLTAGASLPSGAVPGAPGAPVASSVTSPSPSVLPDPASAPSSAPAPASGLASASPSGTRASTSPSPARPRPSPSTSATSGPLTVPAAVLTTPGVIYHGDRHRRVVALTFDDGYSPTALRQILAILKRENAVATFFPYGWAVHQDPPGWHMVVAAGYPIGNHTLSHDILTRLTPAQVTEQMVRGRRTIDLYSGGRSENYMRPPGGAFNAATAKAILKAGYPTIVMWDVDTFDWQHPSVATITARAIRGTNGSIVLMHSGPANTPKALSAIIANYRARGFTFVTISDLLAQAP